MIGTTSRGIIIYTTCPMKKLDTSFGSGEPQELNPVSPSLFEV